LEDGARYENLLDSEAAALMVSAQRKVPHGRTTIEQYGAWVRRYRATRKAEICRNLQGFLDYLASDPKDRVNPKTVRQALNALKFYHEKVLGIEILPNSLRVPAINKNRNIPDILTHEEVMELFSHMSGKPRLQAEILYGTGGRKTALLTRRLKDVDLPRGLITFRFDKGGKSRTVKLPRSVMDRLAAHIAAVRLQWQDDHAKGIICPHDDPSLVRKLGEKRFGTLPFYWLFPSDRVRGNKRWHATDHALNDSLKAAAEKTGIMKRVNPHIFRHCNATSLLDRGENIRTIQEHLGHTHVETTEIYTHAIGANALISPLDLPPIQQIGNLVPFSVSRTA
jgi:site-specific recombinase XerD